MEVKGKVEAICLKLWQIIQMGFNVNIPTQKWKTTKELFMEELDLNYKHPGQRSL